MPLETTVIAPSEDTRVGVAERRQPTTAEKWTHRGLATVVVAALLGFLYPLQGVLDAIAQLQSWQAGWQQPAMAALLLSKLRLCFISLLIAVGAASGMSLPSLLRGVGISFGSKDSTS